LSEWARLPNDLRPIITIIIIKIERCCNIDFTVEIQHMWNVKTKVASLKIVAMEPSQVHSENI
jgi:hypothetical protein